MDKEVIAVVRLMPGQVGYYDDYSGIHMTQMNPVREIYAGTNCKHIATAVKSGRLKLLSGSLSVKTNKEKIAEIRERRKRIKSGVDKCIQEPAPIRFEPPHEVEISFDIPTKIEDNVVDTVTESIKEELKTIKVSPAYVSKLHVGSTKQITSNVEGCTFKSEDEAIAVIDAEGTITAVGEGKTYIVVSGEQCEDKKVSVTVIEPVE